MIDALAATVQRALGDGYRVDRELGGGGMSRVFVAHDLSLDRDVVVKVLSNEATTGVSADRFRREIQLIARLQHPHVVSILSAGEADGSLYYMMPYVTGETLRARLTRERILPVPDVVRLLREVLDALTDVIMRALAKEPAARPQTAREMVAELDTVTTPARVERAASPGGARRRLALAGVVALAAAGAYATWSHARTLTAAPVAEGADLIAVMPLSAVSDSSLARLGQDLVVTLSANLDGVGSLHTVDAVTLLMRARGA